MVIPVSYTHLDVYKRQLLLFLYNRFWLPLIIIGSAMISSSAVFLGLWITGVEFNITAMMGTVMVTNVWMTIIPNQKKIMAITDSGGAPRPELSAQAKRCSKHNTLMSMPLL